MQTEAALWHAVQKARPFSPEFHSPGPPGAPPDPSSAFGPLNESEVDSSPGPSHESSPGPSHGSSTGPSHESSSGPFHESSSGPILRETAPE